jgi:aldehyde dehydrogenase
MSNDPVIQIDLFINQNNVPGPQYFEVRNPGRLNEVVARVAAGTAAHVNDAVAAAHAAFLSWKDTPVKERVERMRLAEAELEKRTAELAVMLTREQGMLLRETQRDVGNGVKALHESAVLAEAFLQAEEFEDGETLVRIEKVARGVVAAIIPWNAPVGLTMGKIGPALMTGNTIVVKPSPFAPVAVSQALQAIAAHFPPGVINIIHGEGEVGPALTRHPLVRKVSFTGGTQTGKLVMAAAADSIKNIGLELGGNDPAIILDDAVPADVMPDLVKAIFPRSGQVCFAVKRVYVPKHMFDKFFGVLCEAVDQYQVGYGLDERSTFAPMNNRNQFDFVEGLIGRTRKSGATVLELGKKLDPDNWNNGYYRLPTVVRDLSPTAELVLTEQFGPVIPVVPYETEEQVLQMANSTEHGLCSSVWSRDTERAMRLARHVEAGTTFINSHARTALGERTMPFGGVKQSGIGRGRTTVGMAEYIEYHAISLKKQNMNEGVK